MNLGIWRNDVGLAIAASEPLGQEKGGGGLCTGFSTGCG